MKPFRLHRRTVLRGAFGATLFLPLLDAMMDGNDALGAGGAEPRRYVVFFGGFSLGADGDPMHNDLVPTTEGPNYALRTATQTFGTTKQYLNIISGLVMPTSGPGALKYNWHGGNHSPLLAGVACKTSEDAKRAALQGETSDQIVAAAFAAQGVKVPHASLQLKVQAKPYSPGPSEGYMMSARRDPTTNALVKLAPDESPSRLYEKLFFGSTGAGTGTVDAATLLHRRKLKSVLDFCSADRTQLMSRVGAADKQQLSSYFDQCRDIERRLEELETTQPTCTTPAHPGKDPAFGQDAAISIDQNLYSTSTCYSNEELRATVHMKLLHAALACDLTRVASMVMTHNQSFMNMYSITGQKSDLHALSHFTRHTPKTTEMAKAQAWHYKHFAHLVQMLADSKDATGKSLLETSALAFINEGGHGQADFGGEAGGAHSSENMVIVTAGGAGGLKQGHHIRVPGAHPARVLLTLMNAVGVSRTNLGEVTGTLPSLLV